jgi:hypothetical protein
MQDEEYKQLWGHVNPGTEYLELLDDTFEVYVPQKADDGGLFSVDVLDPSIVLPLHVLYYFHNFIWYLKKHRYEAGKTLFGFGYDFRQSNMQHVDALEERLEVASQAAGGAKCALTVSAPSLSLPLGLSCCLGQASFQGRYKGLEHGSQTV